MRSEDAVSDTRWKYPGVDADAYGYTEEPVASAPPLRNRSFCLLWQRERDVPPLCQRRLYVSGQGSRKIQSPLSRSLARM